MEDGWSFRARQSGAKATAVQTLRSVGGRQAVAQRLDCGRFTAAFPRTKPSLHSSANFRKQNREPREIREQFLNIHFACSAYFAVKFSMVIDQTILHAVRAYYNVRL